jgi:hypothetical protein
MPVVFNLSFVENLVTALEIESKILPGIGEEDNLFATFFPYELFPVCQELGAEADPLNAGIDSERTGIPGYLELLSSLTTRLKCGRSCAFSSRAASGKRINSHFIICYSITKLRG